ncbi:MAG: hypothetical protein JO051_14865 [Acidobacteriaceae bacterium]|nr:hypothetical protein [Acidobacteriaceae bacterium]
MSWKRFSGAATLLVLASLSFAADGAKTPQPGQLASVQVRTVSAADVSSSSNGILSSVSIADIDERHDRIMDRWWIASMVAAVAGTGFDAATSWGKMEGNSLLASSNGTFGGRAIALKAALTAGVIIPQICFHKKRKEYRTAFITGNFAEAAIFSAVAVHNLRIPNAQQQ